VVLNRSVGIETRYWMDGVAIELWFLRNFQYWWSQTPGA